MALHAALEVVEALAVVRLLLELERAAVLHVLAELAGVTAAELFKTRLNLLLLDVIVLLVLGATGQTLPRQLTLDEVEQDVADRLQIVTSGLLNALVGGNGGVSGGTGQVLAILVGNVLAIAVLVALCETEINNVDVVTGRIRTTDKEVIRLDITMDNALLVDLLNAADELDGDHQHGL